MFKARRIVGGIAVAALVAVPLAACSSSSSKPAASASASPVATIPSLTGEMTQVTLDSGFVSALTSLKVTPSPAGTATIANGVATFPITGGNVTVWAPGTHDPYVEGSIKHEGSGLTLTAGSTVVTLANFTVDPGGSNGNGPDLYGDVISGPLNGGTTLKTQIPIFALDGSTLKPLTTSGDTAILEGTTVRLLQGAADLLNSTYKVTAFKGGLTIGIAKITVNTK